MATGQKEVGYSLDKVGRLTLENTDDDPYYIGIVVCRDKIIVIDRIAYQVQLRTLQDGKLLCTHGLKSEPRAICVINDMEIGMILDKGQIQIMAVDSRDKMATITSTRNLQVQGGFNRYDGVVKLQENLVVCGLKKNTICWCVVSLNYGRVDTIHQICKGFDSNLTTKDNIIYISCYAGLNSPDNGVYGFDILNPSQPKYTYKHEYLWSPGPIAINQDGFIYVCNSGFHSCIHQLTSKCQRVSIYRQRIPQRLSAIFWDHPHGHLYVTCLWSKVMTIFKPEYPGDHKAPEALMRDERKQPVIEETPTQIGQGIPIQQIVEENLNQAGIQTTTKERDLFLRFQREIATTLHFSKDPQSLSDAQKSLTTTEKFIQENHPNLKGKWLEYREQGKLAPELIDVIYSKERNPELHEKKADILSKMKQLNIIAKAMSFNENGVKEANYFFTPCMLRQECPREVITPEQDSRIGSTSFLCWVFTGKFLPPPIFQRLLAACLSCWPVAKKETSENLIFYDCTIFNLDLLHRLTLFCRNHVVFSRITRMGIDDVKTPDAKLCTRVRKFITQNLFKITSCMDQKLQYELCVQNQESPDVSEDSMIHFSPFQMWFVDEGHDPDAAIKPEHMNHARLCIALVTVCGNAMREVLLTQFPAQHQNIYQAILAKKPNLTSRTEIRPGKWEKALLNMGQRQVVFPDPKSRWMAAMDQFDISLLYTLIRNVSTVRPPSSGWGSTPLDGDRSLGANMERIHLYRNQIIGHSVDGKISKQEFDNYWKKIDAVLHDIECVFSKKLYSQELDKQKRQVISIYEAF